MTGARRRSTAASGSTCPSIPTRARSAAGISTGYSGIPNWTFDLGGFSNESRYHTANPTPENLAETLGRVDRLKAAVPAGMDLPEVALRFILSEPTVSTVIPGMRKEAHVERNLAASDGQALPPAVTAVLRKHRWDRTHVIP